MTPLLHKHTGFRSKNSLPVILVLATALAFVFFR